MSNLIQDGGVSLVSKKKKKMIMIMIMILVMIIPVILSMISKQPCGPSVA